MSTDGRLGGRREDTLQRRRAAVLVIPLVMRICFSFSSSQRFDVKMSVLSKQSVGLARNIIQMSNNQRLQI